MCMVHKLKEPYITIVHCVKCQTVSHLQLFKGTKRTYKIKNDVGVHTTSKKPHTGKKIDSPIEC